MFYVDFRKRRATWLRKIVFLSLGLAHLAALATFAGGAPATSTNKPVNLSGYSFTALGSDFPRRVEVAWNRYYDAEGLAAILRRLNEAFPELTRLYSIGKSYEGRELWCLEVTSTNGMAAPRKPGMYIDGNIHGNEVQGAEVVAYTAWYLCHQYGRLPAVTDLLDHNVFYLLPTINPDGRDRWLHLPNTANSARSGDVPFDNDRDGTADEDDYEDLDGDGAITQMRIRDPKGRWKAHPDYPEYLIIPAKPDEAGEFTLVGYEGVDNDGDGEVNEDPVGGYDANRNWAYDWQPPFVQSGAMDYPFCLPETRAVSEFIGRRPNIGAAQSYHNFGGMILRGPGREGGSIQPRDDNTLRIIAQRGEETLPFYRSMVIHKDLYTVWGGELDWLYGARGILSFTSEIWNSRSLTKSNSPPSREEEARFIKHVLMTEGVVAWHECQHPNFGKVEVGGRRKTWGRTPVSFLLEEECHRNMAFTLYHAGQLPRLAISEVQIHPIAPGLHRVWATVGNSRLIPTRTEQDVRHHISPPDTLSLRGPEVRVLSAGQVEDRFFKKVRPVPRRPERVEIATVPGMSESIVQFIVSGRGEFELVLDSAKGGLIRSTRRIR